tara:strand:+ start:219 stop:350 length:132 start_codon:yes stop_codon:yes gene_type:complete
MPIISEKDPNKNSSPINAITILANNFVDCIFIKAITNIYIQVW